jgi:hypothetical protein
VARSLLVLVPFISGCAALKTGGVAGVSAGIGALVGGPAGAVAGAAVGAGTTTLLTSGVSQCEAITGFWPLLGQVIQTGGWLLAGIVIIPLIMGYLIPNGLERKKKAL